MTFSASRLAFADCFKLFDDAVASDKGIKFRIKNRRQAYHYRNRLNHARRLDRRDNYSTFTDPDHPLHGRSIYDGLTVVILFDGSWWLMIEKVESREFEIQPLTGDEINVSEPELYNGGPREATREEEAKPASEPAIGLRRL
jgi:hypothetical protein